MKSLAKLKKIKGDASFREFYRNRENKSIIVISKKEKLKNLLIYDAINKILIKNHLSSLSPKWPQTGPPGRRLQTLNLHYKIRCFLPK